MTNTATPTWTVYFSSPPADPTDPPTVANPGDKSAVTGTAITPFTVSASGGTAPYAWSATGLPSGLSINPSSGEVTGTPTTAGPATVTVTATDANAHSGSATFTITVTAAPTPPSVTNPGNKSFPAGAAIAPFTVTAIGGTEPYTWSADGMPTGLSINPTSGAVSGTPTAQGAASVTVTATDAGALQGSTTFTITVTAPAGELVNIPDANLKAGINVELARKQGRSRTPGQDVTVAEAKLATTIQGSEIPGPVADLTGIQAFTNLTQLSLFESGSTFSDLSPVAGLTKLTLLYLANGRATDASPLAGLTNLTSLGLPGNRITDAAPLTGLSKLTHVELDDNAIRDLSSFPALPKLDTLDLSGNRITSPAPLVGKFDPTIFETLDLSDNRIADASALDQLGEGSTRIEAADALSKGLILSRNRIADLSMYADWSKPLGDRVRGQQIFVGPYLSGGVTVALKSADGTAPAVSPSTAGSYDPASGTLTVADPSAASVTISPSWTVVFDGPPADPGDPGGPVVGGTAQVGQQLDVTDRGAVIQAAACNTSSLRYRWLRDGEQFTGVPYLDGVSNQMGSPGQLQQYRVSATDLGHRLSVLVTCTTNGVQAISASTAVITQSEPEKPAVQSLLTATGADGQNVSSGAPSGVVGDPTNPTVPVYVAQLDATGSLVDPSQIRVELTSISFTSSGYAWLKPTDVQVTGSGARRTIAIAPSEPTWTNGSGAATLHFTVTGTTGKTTDLAIGYVASRATTPTGRVLLGSSDASTTIAVGDGYLLVADDEKSGIGLYDADVSGREVKRQLAGPPPSGLGESEIDYESSARKGDSIWWLGSHGNAKDGEVQASRHSIYRTTLTGSGAGATLTPAGVRYGNLRNDLVAWDRAHGDTYGLAHATGTGQGPDGPAQFNIEGAEFSPDGSALYLGFRAPVYPAAPGGDALIVPLLNLEALTAGTADRAQFGQPILLDLDGQSIREIRKNDRGEYLIIGANAVFNQAASRQTLWAWNGDPDAQPRKLTTELPIDAESAYTDNQGAWEGIGEMPERLVPGAKVQLIMDQGYARLYPTQSENKKDANSWTNKARTDVVTLAGAAGSLAQLTDPGAFPDQAANTIGAAREVTVTNTGSNLLHVEDVSTTDHDAVSADDFLVSGDTCSGATLDLDETCTVRLRFAPSRPDTTSHAELVVRSDVPGGSTTVPLTAHATAAPTSTPSQKAPSTVSAGSVTVAPGQPVSVTAQVTGSAATPTGTVTMRRGSQSLGTATLEQGAATITVPASALTNGVNLFTVDYAGDSSYNLSSAPVVVIVEKAAATVSAQPVGKVVAKKKAALKITVTAPGGLTPAGVVTVTAGGASTAVRLVDGQGTARLTFKTPGARTVFLSYGGSADLSEATGTATVKVKPARKKHRHGRVAGGRFATTPWWTELDGF